MRSDVFNLDDPRIDEAICDLRQLIEERYPDATFDVFVGEDPVGVYLRVTVDVGDINEVLDVVIDQLYEYQVDHGLPVYVLPVQPLVIEKWATPGPTRRPSTPDRSADCADFKDWKRAGTCPKAAGVP
jgi:hypothetical protein